MHSSIRSEIQMNNSQQVSWIDKTNTSFYITSRLTTYSPFERFAQPSWGQSPPLRIRIHDTTYSLKDTCFFILISPLHCCSESCTRYRIYDTTYSQRQLGFNLRTTTKSRGEITWNNKM